MSELCKHESFCATCNVIRTKDAKSFSADLTIKCEQCGTPFQFIGLPAGLDLNGAATSADATEARLAIAPKGQVRTVLDGAFAGFSVRREGIELRRELREFAERCEKQLRKGDVKYGIDNWKDAGISDSLRDGLHSAFHIAKRENSIEEWANVAVYAMFLAWRAEHNK